jgi:hypothetical protein
MSDSNDPVEQFLKLLENPRVQAFFDNIVNKAVEKKINESYETTEFKTAVDSMLITSELKPIKRIFELEKTIGIYQFEDFEEHDITLPEQINLLAERIDNLESTPSTYAPVEPKGIIPETKTEVRAVFIKEYLDNKAKNTDTEMLFLNNNDLKDLIIHLIPESKPECEVKKGQNIRKIKKDVIDKLAKIFPSSISINKNKNGRHETRVLFKSSHTVT